MPEDSADVAKQPKRLFVPSLAVPALAIAISNTTITLLLLEIAASFQINEGLAAQLRTINAAGEVVFAVVMSFLSFRFKHKSLLLLGTFLITFSALGTFFAPTFDLLLFFSFVEGIGTVVVAIMAFTIIGDILPLNKKAKAVSWVVTAGFISTLLGTPAISYVASFGGWRFPFLLLVLPVSIVGIVLAFINIPSSKTISKQVAFDKKTFVHNLKEIFSSRSAGACLIGSLFFPGIAPSLFIVAFFRQQLSLPIDQTVYIILVAASAYVIGSIAAGRLGNKVGTKPLAVVGMFGSGVSLVLLFFSSDVWVAMVLNCVNSWLTGTALAAYPCLALEQLPKSRSIMMSLNRVFTSAGTTIAPALGGALFIMYSAQSAEVGYQVVGIALCALCLVAAGIFGLLVKDPNKTQLP